MGKYLKNVRSLETTARINLVVLWIGCFITELGNALTLPFLPLYIGTLGHFSAWQLNVLSGLAFAITYLAKTIVSPLWGRLADAKGRKLMCLRASGVMTLTIIANGLVPNVWWLIVFRALQGSFSGYVNNSQALIADATPAKTKGRALGILATGGVTGGLVGPLAGGLIADSFGYRMTFFIAGIGMLVVFLMTLILVKEDFTPRAVVKKSKQDSLKMTNMPKILLAVCMVALTVQASATTIQPIVSLFVESLSGTSKVALLSGIVTAMPGLATLLFAPFFGKIVDKIGAMKVLIWGMIGATITIIPMLWLKNVPQFAGLRFIFGISDAAIIPAYQTLMTQSVSKQEFGRAFSYSQSFQAFGNVVGPLLGAMLASIAGYHSVFALTLVLEVVSLSYLLFARKKND